MRVQEKINKVLELAKEILPVREYSIIKDNMESEKYNSVRYYVEDELERAEKRVLQSIYEDKYDEVYASKYKAFKKIDNEITFLCELI
jgi:hypothetical protein